MKLGDRYQVDALAKNRAALIDAVEILSRPVKGGGGGFGLTIRSHYQSDEILEECRPSVLQVFKAELQVVNDKLAAIGVEVDD